MIINLIKSAGVSPALFTAVMDLLQSVPGPLQFCCDPSSVVDYNEEDVEIKHIPNAGAFEKASSILKFSNESLINFPMERQTVSWDTIFEQCKGFRSAKKMPGDEFVILLTDTANRQNWFASLDERMPYNGFIHTEDWAHYIDCPPAFPVAYEVIALVIQKHMFNGIPEMRQKVHEKPIGCINDLCLQKREIILKLRTADICRDCMEMLRGKMAIHELQHALALMESLRLKMLFAQNFRQTAPLSRLVVDGQKRIFLTDFANIEIKLGPLDKALYLLFLRYPQGIYISSLSDHREELYGIYASVSSNGNVDEMRKRVRELTNALANSASEKISRIKKAFEQALGQELARHYYIRGENGAPKLVHLDRSKLIVK